MFVSNVEHVNTHGGSIRVYVKKGFAEINPNVWKFLNDEQEFGLTDYQTYLDFAERIKQAKANVVKNIKSLKNYMNPRVEKCLSS